MPTLRHCNTGGTSGPPISYHKKTYFPMYARCSENRNRLIRCMKIEQIGKSVKREAAPCSGTKKNLNMGAQTVAYVKPPKLSKNCTA